MSTGQDVWLVIAGTVVALGVAALLWPRLAARAAVLTVSVLGAVLTGGALLLQEDPRLADWAVALGVVVAFAPLHCRFAFGPPGARRHATRVVAADGDGA
jgi:hypothetical protein